MRYVIILYPCSLLYKIFRRRNTNRCIRRTFYLITAAVMLLLYYNYPHYVRPTFYQNKYRLIVGCRNFSMLLLPRKEIPINNIHWQRLVTSDGTFYLFGAYLDQRIPDQRLVRVLAMIDHVDPSVLIHAQLWFVTDGTKSAQEVLFTSECEYKHAWHKKWGHRTSIHPYLITCKVPRGSPGIVSHVSLVEKLCERAENSLVINEPFTGEKKDFAVCVKGLKVQSTKAGLRLVEWIELINLLGASKIYLYEISTHERIKNILKYYQTRGLIDVSHITVPKLKKSIVNPSLTKRYNEMIGYNDCLYKHQQSYNYLVLLDTDEVILPTTVKTWQDLFKILKPRFKLSLYKKINSICLRNIYYLDELRPRNAWLTEVPRHLHIMQHVYRTKNFTRLGHYTKCFHNTRNVVLLHNHFAFACMGDKCLYHHLDVNLAQLSHYREKCHSESIKTCTQMKKEVVKDMTMLRYKEELVERVKVALKELSIDGEVWSNSTVSSSTVKRLTTLK